MPLPLRVFEERYRAMTRELLRTSGVFGVLLIRQGQEVGGGALPYEVGTTAVIEEYEEVEDGRFVLACRGVQRFRLLRMLPPRPYPFGEVEVIRETKPVPSARLSQALEHVRVVFPGYFRQALALTDQWARPFSLPDDPNALVNLLGPWLKAEETDKQQLIELEDPTERVECLGALLDRLAAEVTTEVRARRRQRFGGLGSQN